MRIFLTGATGFIGRHLVKELLTHGHRVLGLARSDDGAKALLAAGAEVQRGALEDLEVLQSAAASSDGVIHCGFNHDFSKFMENCQLDMRVIEAIGSALAGSDRPFVVSSGLAGLSKPGRLATEETAIPADFHLPRVSEETALSLVSKGVRASVMRLPQVHDTTKQGLFSYVIQQAREKGTAAYVGDGKNRWAAAHVSDVAQLYRLAIETSEAGARWHAVAEDLTFREAVETIGRGLVVPAVSVPPDQAGEHFGWWGMLAGGDLTGSSLITRQKLGWNPTGPGLLADLQQMDYSQHG